jgi:predicted Zn-dependent peptidase
LIPAAGLLNSVGAGYWSLSEVKQKFAALGVDYSFNAYQNFLQVSITGREDNFEEGLELLNLLLEKPKIDENTKKIYVNRTTADYKIEKSNPGFMGSALWNYAAYGDESFYKVRKGKKALKALDAEQSIQLFQNSVNNYEAEIIYVGKNDEEKVKKLVSKYIPLSKTPKKEAFIDLEGKEYEKNTILFVNDKKAIQSQVYFHLMGNEFTNDQFPDLVAFNGYFGDGFSGLVLQEIREYRSLAYSAYGYYNRPVFEGNKGRFIGYIGCQGDKTNDAIPVMVGLINQMPSKPERIEALRQTLKLKVVTSFPTYRELPFTISSYELTGYDEDPKKSAYKRYDEVDMSVIENFYEKHIADNPYVITIYGDKRKIDLDELKKYGEVIELKEKDFINDIAVPRNFPENQ